MTTETQPTTITIRTSRKTGNRFLLHDGQLWRLATPQDTCDAVRSNSVPDGRQLGFLRNGDYGPEMAAYVRAAEALGLPVYYAWRGIMNSLGDHAGCSPPYNPISVAEVPDYDEVVIPVSA